MPCRYFFFLFFPVLALGDDLQPLGDEFEDAQTLSQWQDLGVVEGWHTPSVQAADINTTSPGHFRITPGALTWFQNLRGSLFFKEVTGDFIVTLKLRIFSRHNPADPTEVPNRSFSLSGILVHGPRSIVQAAPSPYTTAAVLPGTSGSDWIPNTENYLFLSAGTAGSPGTRQFEIKATRNSSSRLYFNSTGMPQTSNEAWLQMVRVGDTIVCLRKHLESDPWIVENRYPNPDHLFPDFGETLQVGITAYSDWPTAQSANNSVNASFHFNYAPPSNGSPDLISEVDYCRFQRPHALLTEAVLEEMATSYNPTTNSTADPPTDLTASPMAMAYLGDHANVPVGRLLVSGSVGGEGAPLQISVSRMGSSEGSVSCAFQMSAGSATAEDVQLTSGTLTWAEGDASDKVIDVLSTHDRVAEGPETFTILLNQLNGPASLAAGALSQTIHVTLNDHPLDQWRLDQFGAEANTALGQMVGDYDGDAYPNLIERALGMNPRASDPDPFTTTSAEDLFDLAFTPAADIDDTTLVVEVSEGLAEGTWTPLCNRPAGSLVWQLNDEATTVEVDAETGIVRVRHQVNNTSIDRRFYRLAAMVE